MNSSFTPRRLVRRLSLVLLGLLLVTGSAFAQISTGSISGKVVDNDGNGLPGVTVTLTGAGAPQVAISESDGTFRYPSLPPGSYELKAELSGMGVSTATVPVNIGRNQSVTMKLAPTIQQTITVTAETPLLDTRKTGTGATVTKVELEEIPTARDPWVILQQVPGVLTDRINVGGNESGQQSSFVGKGAGGDQATFNVDGVNITDMSALGSSPAYYDFDSFEEIQVATGGTDPRIQTPGVQLNMVYKRGTNDFRGSGRYFHTNGEESKVSPEAKPYLNFFNAIDAVDDYGLELGGPVIKDRLWLWGAYGRNQIDLFVAQPKCNQQPGFSTSDPCTSAAAQSIARYTDKTKLETINGKVNAQITTNNSAVLLYTDSGKTKFGRNASPTRPPATTFNQDKYGPKGNYKIEDTHIFSSNFYLTGMYSKTNGGFQLVPNSGKNCTDFDCINASDTQNAWIDAATGVWSRSFLYAFIKRPQDQFRGDGSAFFETGSLNHELKFGAGYREVKQQTQSGWVHDQYFGDYTGFGEPDCCGVAFFRPSRSDVTGKYTDLYVGDTLLLGNLTIQGGLRWDEQKGSSGAISVPANPDIPTIMPAASLNIPDEVKWTSVSPRLGFTYTLGSARRTVLRGGYNRYVDQLGTGTIGAANPFNLYTYLYFYGVNDANHDRHITGAELAGSPNAYIYATYGIDPNDPTHAKQLIRFDKDMNPPHTDEFVAGFEHELMSDFTIGATYTHRTLDDFIYTRFEKHKGQGDWYSAADYTLLGNATGKLPPCPVNATTGRVPAGGCTGDAFTVPVYVLKSGISTPTFGVITNRPDYSQNYDGLEITAVKRMSHHWMLRGNFSWNDWTQDVGAAANADPTRLRTTSGCSNCDGGIVVQGSGTGSGAKGGVYINSGWSYNVTGVVQLPWQFSLGASAIGRQGYPIPYVARVNTGPNTSGGEGFKQVLIVDDIDNFRNPDVFNLDLRFAKDFRFNQVGLTLSLDAFNVTDERTILQRTTRINSSRTGTYSAANRVTEAQAPRVFRLGARFTF